MVETAKASTGAGEIWQMRSRLWKSKATHIHKKTRTDEPHGLAAKPGTCPVSIKHNKEQGA